MKLDQLSYFSYLCTLDTKAACFEPAEKYYEVGTLPPNIFAKTVEKQPPFLIKGKHYPEIIIYHARVGS